MAKKKKTSTTAGTADTAVTLSRYASPPIALSIDNVLFFVPEVLLQSLSDLPRSESDDTKIELPDVDTETGHIIAHFLYTGTYQLPPTHPDHVGEEGLSKPKAADFKKSIAAFVAAKKYGLTELQELAKYETERIAAEISVAQAAHAVGKDTLASLQEDAGWLQGIVLRKAEQTFEENDGIFSSGSFFNGIKSLKLAKLLGQRVADLYRRRILQLRESPKGSYDRSIDAADFGTDKAAEEVVEQSMGGSVEEAVEAAVDEIVSTASASEFVEEDLPVPQAMDILTNGVSCVSTEEITAQPGQDITLAEAITTQPEQELVATEGYISDNPVAVAESYPEPVSETGGTCIVVEPSSMSEHSLTTAPVPESSESTPPEQEDALRSHYLAKTGPFELLSKKERQRLRKKLRMEAAASKAEENTEAARSLALVGKVESETAGQEVDVTYTAPLEENGTAYTAPIEKSANVEHQDLPVGLSKAQKKKKKKKRRLQKQLEEEAQAKGNEGEANIIYEVPT